MTDEEFRAAKTALICEIAAAEHVNEKDPWILSVFEQRVDDDLEGWEERNRAAGGKDPFIRRQYLRACEVRRESESTLGGYLKVLARRFGLPGLDRCAFAPDHSDLAGWLYEAWMFGEAVPTEAQLESVIAAFPLSSVEKSHLRVLRDEAWISATAPEPIIEDLSEYLERVGGAGLGLALAGLRARKSAWSLAKFAAEAEVSVEIWQRWESGTLPDVDRLDDVLKRLEWIRDEDIVDAALDDSDDLKKPDDELWQAFREHHWDDEEDEDAEMLPVSPEALEAGRRTDERIFGTSDPDEIRTKLKASYEAFATRTERSAGSYLKELRKQLETSVEDMARRGGVPETTWLAWESEKKLPTFDEAEALAYRLLRPGYQRDKLIEIAKTTAA